MNLKNIIKLGMGALAIAASTNAYSKPHYCKEWRHQVDSWGGNQYIRWDRVHKYMLVNNDYVFTAHADRTLTTGSQADAHFFSDEAGFVGKDDVSWTSGDAKMTYKFSNTGNHEIWVEKYDSSYDLCAYTDVTVQNAPTVNSTMSQTPYNNRVEGTIYMSGTIDQANSKNGKEGIPIFYEVQKMVTSKWTGSSCQLDEGAARWTTVRGLSQSNQYSYSFQDCVVDYRVRSFDGTYYSSWKYNFSYYQPGHASGGGSGGGPLY